MPTQLTLTGLDIVVCLTTLLGSLAVGLLLALRYKAGESSDNFFLAGRRLTWPLIGASLYSTNIGAEHLVGLSGDSYRYGLCAGTVELTTAICLGFGVAVLVPYYLNTRVFTIPEFLELRYNSAARVFFSGLMLVICIMTKMAFTLYAGAIVVNGLVGWDVMHTVALLGLLSAVVTIIGGFAGVAYSDFIHTVIMIVGCALMLFIGLGKVGGWSGLEAHLTALSGTQPNVTAAAMHIYRPYDDVNYPFWGIILGAIYGGTFYWGIDQVNVQRMLGAPNLRQARWGAMLAILLKLTPVFIFALPGVIALALYPGREPKTTFITLLNELLPSGLRGLVLAGLLGALIASLLAVMNSISTMVVRDFVVRVRPDIPERSQVRLGRVAVLLAMAAGVGAAYLVYKTPDGLYKYLQTISIYLVMPVTPAIIFGILSKRVTLYGAFVSVLVGVGLAALFVADQLMGVEAGSRAFPFLHHTLTINYTYRGLWGTIIITVALFAVSAFTPRTSPVKLEQTTIDWSGESEPFLGLADWRLQWTVLAAISVGLYAWLW